MNLTSLGLKKPEGTDPVDVQDFNDNADLIDQELQNRPKKDGDAGNMTVAFTEAKQLTDLESNESLGGLFGKLRLAIKKLKALITLTGETDISAIGDGTVTGALTAVNSNLESEIKKMGQIEYIYLKQTLGATSNSAPWLELEAQYNSFVDHKLYVGRINVGAQCVFIGMRTSDAYGTFLVQMYSQLYHVYIKGGTWFCQNLKSHHAPNYAGAITPLSQDITSGTWEYIAPCDGFLIFNVTVTAVTAVAFGIKGAGVTTFYEQNYASQPARMTRIIPMAEGDVFNVTDCVHANVTTATKFVPYKC